MDTTQKQDWRKGKKNWMLLGLGGDLMLIQVTNDMTSYFLCCVCKDGRDAVIEALVCEIMSGNMQGNDHLLWLVEININSRNNDSHANKITKGNATLYFYLEAYFCAVISTFTFRNLSFHKKWIPVHDKFQMSAHSFASLSWQESVITHALSCKLAIYSEAFWGFSNWLWGHWRGTWKSVGIKKTVYVILHIPKPWIFSSLAQPSIKFGEECERKLLPLLCAAVKMSAVWLAHLQSVKMPLALWCLRFAGFRCSDIRGIKSHPRVRYREGRRDADHVNMIWSFDGKQIVT